MDYAVVLYLDMEAEHKIQAIINKVVENGVNPYMVSTKIPPHITIGAFKSTDHCSLLINRVDNDIEKFTAGQVFWASIGIFNPNVLYLAPVLNKYLQTSCEQINESLKDITEIGDNGHYLPYQWVPHTAIAVKLDDEELKNAFEIVQKEFQAFGGTANRLVLAQCNPYKEIKIWQLEVRM